MDVKRVQTLKITEKTHHLLGVEELPVGPTTDLVHHRGLKVQEDGSGDMLPRPSLAEEGRETVVSTGSTLVTEKIVER